jgi:uncharacterized membrane protein YdcZ (DUF606 family)
MFFRMIAPFIIGALGVLQNTWNKQIAEQWGIAKAIFFNSAVMVVISSLFWLGLKMLPDQNLPEIYKNKSEGWSFSLFHILPGLAGFLIVITLPFVIQRVGALRVFVGIVAGQIVASILWDYFVESIGISANRAIGAILALIGTIIAVK